jgi:hypothetical protein
MSIWSYKFVGGAIEGTIKADSLDNALIEIRKVFPNKELLFIKYLCY